MNCILIDDEDMCRLNIRQLCKKVEGLNLVAEFENPTLALPRIKQGGIDLIFLDLHMPELSGSDFLKSVSDLPQVIITTTDISFALDAFQFNVTDYLIKPVALPRFLKAHEKAKDIYALRSGKDRRKREEKETELFVTIDRKLIKIRFDDILFIEASGDYIFIHTTQKKLLTHSTLKKVEERLPSDVFNKIHRSYIVNLSKISDIQDSNVLIEDQMVPISRANREKLISKLNLL